MKTIFLYLILPLPAMAATFTWEQSAAVKVDSFNFYGAYSNTVPLSTNNPSWLVVTNVPGTFRTFSMPLPDGMIYFFATAQNTNNRCSAPSLVATMDFIPPPPTNIVVTNPPPAPPVTNCDSFMVVGGKSNKGLNVGVTSNTVFVFTKILPDEATNICRIGFLMQRLGAAPPDFDVEFRPDLNGEPDTLVLGTTHVPGPSVSGLLDTNKFSMPSDFALLLTPIWAGVHLVKPNGGQYFSMRCQMGIGEMATSADGITWTNMPWTLTTYLDAH
jgi:hypothetical protein